MKAFSKFFIFLFLFSSLYAQNVKLPAIIGDNMVLQQNSSVPIWGKAKPGSVISISASWGKDVSATTKDDSTWKINIETPPAGGPFQMKINSGKDSLLINNVLIGEVWFCSGQSNMEMPMIGFLPKDPLQNSKEEIANAVYPLIRLFHVKKNASYVPLDYCGGEWLPCDTSSVKEFSATAYFFGQKLFNELNIPIGLIHASWGGTPAEAWTNKKYLSQFTEFTDSLILKEIQENIDTKKVKFYRTPEKLYNAMVAPLIPFTIKGVIWYQGESNTPNPFLYEKLFPAMIKNWREDWGYDFPFYYVQIAPYRHGSPIGSQYLRDAQRKTLSLPNTGMAVTLDIGDSLTVHPANKKSVGERLAFLALAKLYYKNIPFSGPLYKSHAIKGKEIELQFDYIGKGLKLLNNEKTNFEIAGSDRVFVPAEVKIVGDKLFVWSDEIKEPQAVRYAWSSLVVPTLFNKEGLPASSFRTDEW
ncbi:MAG: sialate O-acetylesterase [Melioribacteraceae bacterium]